MKSLLPRRRPRHRPRDPPEPPSPPTTPPPPALVPLEIRFHGRDRTGPPAAAAPPSSATATTATATATCAPSAAAAAACGALTSTAQSRRRAHDAALPSDSNDPCTAAGNYSSAYPAPQSSSAAGDAVGSAAALWGGGDCAPGFVPRRSTGSLRDRRAVPGPLPIPRPVVIGRWEDDDEYADGYVGGDDELRVGRKGEEMERAESFSMSSVTESNDASVVDGKLMSDLLSAGCGEFGTPGKECLSEGDLAHRNNVPVKIKELLARLSGAPTALGDCGEDVEDGSNAEYMFRPRNDLPRIRSSFRRLMMTSDGIPVIVEQDEEMDVAPNSDTLRFEGSRSMALKNPIKLVNVFRRRRNSA